MAWVLLLFRFGLFSTGSRRSEYKCHAPPTLAIVDRPRIKVVPPCLVAGLEKAKNRVRSDVAAPASAKDPALPAPARAHRTAAHRPGRAFAGRAARARYSQSQQAARKPAIPTATFLAREMATRSLCKLRPQRLERLRPERLPPEKALTRGGVNGSAAHTEVAAQTKGSCLVKRTKVSSLVAWAANGTPSCRHMLASCVPVECCIS